MLASLGPVFRTHLILHIRQAKRAPLSTQSQLQTERIAPKAGTHETNKSMCPSKALCLFVSVNRACHQCCPVCLLSGFGQTIPHLAVDVCMFVWMCMFVSLVHLCVRMTPNPGLSKRTAKASVSFQGLPFNFSVSCCFF